MKKIAIAVAVIVAVGVGGVSYVNSVASKQARLEIDKQFALISEETDVTFTYADVSASVIAKSVKISDLNMISAEGEQVANINSIVVKGYDPEHISPHSSVDISGFKLSEALIAQVPDEFNNMLASASYDLHSSLDYDEKSGNSDVVFNVAAKDIVSLNMELGLANSTPLIEVSLAAQQQANTAALSDEQLEEQQIRVLEAMNELEPRRMNLALKNEGQLKALLASELSKQGMTVEQMQMMVEMQLQQMPVNPDIAQAINGFVKGLNSLSVSASLPAGKTLTEINEQIMMLADQPDEVAKLINLEVKGS